MNRRLGNRRIINSNTLIGFIALVVLFFSGCATEHVIIEKSADQAVVVTEPELEPEEDPSDPLEGFNRAMYNFNETIDTYFAEPITTAYKWITPQFVQTGVSNFYSNMGGIGVIFNDFLQAKFTQGASDTGRLALNTTVGLLGMIDVASYVGLEQHDEDFGQTLAVWGVPAGPYLVLPFVGPGTFREIPGSIVDAAVHPVTYLPVGFAAVAALNRRANAEGALKFIDEAALDPYVFTRESYLQFREHQAADGQAGVADGLDELEQELFDEDEFDEYDDEQMDAVDTETSDDAEPASGDDNSRVSNGAAVEAIIEERDQRDAATQEPEPAAVDDQKVPSEPINTRRYRRAAW